MLQVKKYLHLIFLSYFTTLGSKPVNNVLAEYCIQVILHNYGPAFDELLIFLQL